MLRVPGTILAVALFVWPVVAFADEATESASESEQQHKLVVSASMLRPVVAKMGELGAEVRIKDRFAASMTLGLGPATVDTRDMAGDFGTDDVVCFSGGAQGRYYVWGTFDRGLFGGAELVYIHLARDRETSVRPRHEGVWAGPTVGYKHTFGFGMMVSAVFTVGLPLHKPDGLEDEDVPGEPTDDGAPVAGGALLWPNLVVGWAF